MARYSGPYSFHCEELADVDRLKRDEADAEHQRLRHAVVAPQQFRRGEKVFVIVVVNESSEQLPTGHQRGRGFLPAAAADDNDVRALAHQADMLAVDGAQIEIGIEHGVIPPGHEGCSHLRHGAAVVGERVQGVIAGADQDETGNNDHDEKCHLAAKFSAAHAVRRGRKIGSVSVASTMSSLLVGDWQSVRAPIPCAVECPRPLGTTGSPPFPIPRSGRGSAVRSR